MNPTLKYALGRLGLFVLVAVPLMVLVPGLDSYVKLMIAVLISAALSFFLLRRWRDEVAERMSANRAHKQSEKERLRSALAGEEPV